MPDFPDDDVLVTRAEARRMLGGIGRDLLLKLENEGKLHPIKLTASAKGHVFYRKSEVLALMRFGPPAPPARPKVERATLKFAEHDVAAAPRAALIEGGR
jgi:hypothetical protein